MLDFRKKTDGRAPLSQQAQRRVPILLAGLALVLVLLREAGHPERWRWLADPLSGGAARRRQVDTRLAAQRREQPSAAGPTSHAPGGQSGLDLSPDELAAIRDDTYFRGGEHAVWFNLCDALRHMSSAQIAASSMGPVTFLQLYQQPSAYRGKVVSVHGTVRMVADKHAPANDMGIEHYYQVWLQPADELSSLIVIYALELPPGFPRDGSLEEPVRVDGFFFKRWAYRAKDTIRTAPLLLAKTLAWQRRPSPAARPQPDFATTMAFVVAVLAGAALVVWLIARRTSGGARLAHYLNRAPDLVGDELPPPEEAN